VFRLRGGTWSQTAVLAAAHGAAGDLFGGSVALSAAGSTALVGASGASSNTGKAYVFRLRAGAWSQVAVLAGSRVPRGVAFGGSVALSPAGSTALIGAGSGPVRGVAYVFRLRGGTWSQVAQLTASDGASFDGFGSSVALSAPGSTALVGAPDHSAAGAAYVFTGVGRA
jgi:FG-GAP repeat